jgi:hypothetical protein
LKGSALFEINVTGEWLPRPIDALGNTTNKKAISIAENVWHRIKIGPTNFVSLSFHTAAAKKLIEETPVKDDLNKTRQRLYSTL